MAFKPVPCASRWEGLAASLWIVLIDLLFIVWAIRRPADLLKFLLIVVVVGSLPLLAYVLYRTWAAFSLEYWVDRNAITVRWAHMRQVIPLHSVTQIEEGGYLAIGKPRLADWPAPYLREVGGDSEAHLLATLPPEQSLLLDSPHGVYVLSPAQPQGFLAAVQERFALGPSQVVVPMRTRSTELSRLLPMDRLGLWLLVGGLLGVLILFGVLMISFPDLPDVLTVRYNSQGAPDLISEKSALYRLPIIGLLAWGINGAAGLLLMARRQPVGAYMLWGGAIIVQVFSLLALVSLIT